MSKGEPIGVSLPHPPGMAPEYWAEREAWFRKELKHLLNSNSRENGSDTPDFILAEYLADCLAAWDKAVKRRTQWYGGCVADAVESTNTNSNK